MSNEPFSHVRAQNQQGHLRATSLLGQMCLDCTTRVASVSACLPHCVLAVMCALKEWVLLLGVLWAISVCSSTHWRHLSPSLSPSLASSTFLSPSLSLSFLGPAADGVGTGAQVLLLNSAS